MVGQDKFYTVPFSSGSRFEGIIVPAGSTDRAGRVANMHSQNMAPEPPRLKKSEVHLTTAKEMSMSNKWQSNGPGDARYVVANERIE